MHPQLKNTFSENNFVLVALRASLIFVLLSLNTEECTCHDDE